MGALACRAARFCWAGVAGEAEPEAIAAARTWVGAAAFGSSAASDTIGLGCELAGTVDTGIIGAAATQATAVATAVETPGVTIGVARRGGGVCAVGED